MIDRVTQIKVRKVLRQLPWHDAVRYSGPIFMASSRGRPPVYMGEDYEFRDRLYEDWDCERAFRPKSKTRKHMNKIVDLLQAKKPSKPFILGRYTYTHSVSNAGKLRG